MRSYVAACTGNFTCQKKKFVRKQKKNCQKKNRKKFRKMIIERAGYLATAIRVHQNIENVSMFEFPLVKMCQKYGLLGTYNLYA
jgi:hypothetical protein